MSRWRWWRQGLGRGLSKRMQADRVTEQTMFLCILAKSAGKKLSTRFLPRWWTVSSLPLTVHTSLASCCAKKFLCSVLIYSNRYYKWGYVYDVLYIYIYIQGLWFVVMRMSHVTWPFEMCSVNYLLYEKIIFIWKLHEIKIYVAQMFFFSCEWKVFVSSIDMRLRKVDGCWRTNNVIVWNCSLNYLLFKKILIYLLLNFIIYVRKALYFLFDSFACYKIYEIQVKIFFKQVIFSIYKLCYKE